MKNAKKKTSPLKLFIVQNLVCKVSFLHIEQIRRRIKTVTILIWRCLFFGITVFFKFSKNGRKPTQKAPNTKFIMVKVKIPNRISQK